MAKLFIDTKELDTLINAIKSLAANALTVDDAARVGPLILTLNDRMDAAEAPFGRKLGEYLDAAPRDGEKVFSVRFDSEEWQGMRMILAYNLEAACKKVDPRLDLSGDQDPIYGDQDDYFRDLFPALIERGFSVQHVPDKGFAVYAPQRPQPAKTFNKAVSYAPAP